VPPRDRPEPQLEDVEEPDEADEPEEPDEDEAVPVAPSDEEGEEEASLEELLAQRASRRAAEEGEDETDIMALASERDVSARDSLSTRVIPINRHEFVCNRCHLVKARSQLADEGRGLCRDCV
jgi:hypothetical protein